MLRWFKQTFDGPRIWLTIGAVMIAFSLVVGYYQDQRLADATLAEKIGLPSPVAIQDFSQDKHTNMLAEFQLFAEVDLSAADVRAIGPEDAREIYLFVPAYPISDGGQQWTTSLPGSGAAAGRAAQSPLSSQRPSPAAILIFDISLDATQPRGFSEMGLQPLGAGLGGEVVLLAGKMFDRSMWQDALSGAAFNAALVDFLGEGAQALPLIAPYRNGKAVGAAAPDLSRLEYVYLAFGMAFVLCGGIMLTKRYIPEPQRKVQKTSVGTVRKPSIPPFTFFQPIVSQEELIDADQDAPPSAYVPRFVARAAGAIARGASTRAKSRL